jgi:hypothetical protein
MHGMGGQWRSGVAFLTTAMGVQRRMGVVGLLQLMLPLQPHVRVSWYPTVCYAVTIVGISPRGSNLMAFEIAEDHVDNDAARRGDIEALQAEAARWRERAAAKRAQVELFETMVGAHVLDANDGTAKADHVADELDRLRAELDTAAAAVTAAEERIEQVHKAKLRARAVDLRTQAAVLVAEAERLDGQAARLLGDLAEVQGVTYFPAGGTLTRADQLRQRAREIEGQALCFDAACEGERVSVSTDTRCGRPLWATARMVGNHVGDDPVLWLRRIETEAHAVAV